MEKQIQLHIGGFFASCKPATIMTVLGSCVAVCLFDPVEKIGGMNHMLLPGKADMKFFDDSARYGVNAMELLINGMLKVGADRNRLVAKAFGGANVIPSISNTNGIGRQNMEFTLEFLERDGIPIISRDLGGNDSRKIYFQTRTGDVFLKRISWVNFRGIARAEERYLDCVQKDAAKMGNVDLF